MLLSFLSRFTVYALRLSVYRRRSEVARSDFGGLRGAAVGGRALLVEGLGGVHGLVGGDEELVERLAVDAVGGRADRDADARVLVAADVQGELRDGALDALAQLDRLLGRQVLHDGDELVARVAREEVVLAQLRL